MATGSLAHMSNDCNNSLENKTKFDNFIMVTDHNNLTIMKTRVSKVSQMTMFDCKCVTLYNKGCI